MYFGYHVLHYILSGSNDDGDSYDCLPWIVDKLHQRVRKLSRHLSTRLISPVGLYQLHKNSFSDTKAPFLNLHLSISNSTIYQYNVMILSFQTDMPRQTMQTKIRLLLIRVYTVCHSVCIIWTHYSMEKPHRSDFRVITTNVLGVRIFRKFTVLSRLKSITNGMLLSVLFLSSF